MIQAIKSLLQDKSKSSFSLYYLGFWVIYHWQAIYVSIFVGGNYIYDRYELLKDEYVYQHFLGVWGVSGGWAHLIWSIAGYIVPFILACLVIWVFSKFTNKAYKKEQENCVTREIYKLKERIRVEKAKQESAVARAETVEAEGRLVKNKKSFCKMHLKSNGERSSITWRRVSI